MSTNINVVRDTMDFERIREQAVAQQLLAGLTRAPIDLLSFDEVRDRLHVREVRDRGLRDIPIDNIVGSVGRYRDFSRSFLPRRIESKGRWTRLMGLATGMQGWPPIEVFQVGDVYFVKDGNHRVSVARQLGMKTIQAYVRECKSPVPLDVNTTPTDVIALADMADFLSLTGLDQTRPENGIEFTTPGCYSDLLAHIAAHQYFVEQETGKKISFEEAAASWYDNVYLPLIDLIRKTQVLEDFPHRTEADMYVWAVRHEIDLRKACRVADVDDRLVLEDISRQYSGRPILRQFKTMQRLVRRAIGRLFGRGSTPVGLVCPVEVPGEESDDST